jgi:hypothetical protein
MIFDETVFELVSGTGALSRDQLKLFDEPWPPKKDWKKRIIGAEITQKHYDLLLIMRSECDQRKEADNKNQLKKIKKAQKSAKKSRNQNLPKIQKVIPIQKPIHAPVIKHNYQGDFDSRIYLDVPYAEKDNAKSFGAKWDFNLKRWYVAEQEDITELSKWFSDNQPPRKSINAHMRALK